MISSIDELLRTVKSDIREWGGDAVPWFRGEPLRTDNPVLARVYRESHNENSLLQAFRRKAPTLSANPTPPRGHTDEWLFLAQHMRLPTRLLDWSESLLVALYFSLDYSKDGSALWMLNPLELNAQAAGRRAFGITWFQPELAISSWIHRLLEPDRRNMMPRADFLVRMRHRVKSSKTSNNFANVNIRGAWENDRIGTWKPVAIYPTNIHPRMGSQKSTFTIWGKDKRSLPDQVGTDVLRRYEIDQGAVQAIRSDLHLLGITRSTLFPDLEGLAQELAVLH